MSELQNLMLGGVTVSFKHYNMENLKNIKRKYGLHKPDLTVSDRGLERNYLLRLKAKVIEP